MSEGVDRIQIPNLPEGFEELEGTMRILEAHIRNLETRVLNSELKAKLLAARLYNMMSYLDTREKIAFLILSDDALEDTDPERSTRLFNDIQSYEKKIQEAKNELRADIWPEQVSAEERDENDE